MRTHPCALVVQTRATGGVKDDSSDHARAVVVRWTKACHVHLLLPNVIHSRNRQFRIRSTAIRIPAKLPRDVAIAVAETSKESAISFGNLCRETMKCRGRSAEITARRRKISISQERSRRLGEKPGEEERERSSFYILEARNYSYSPHNVAMGQGQDRRHERKEMGLRGRNSKRCRSAVGPDSTKRERWMEDQKPCGRREGHVSIFRGVWRILCAGSKTNE